MLYHYYQKDERERHRKHGKNLTKCFCLSNPQSVCILPLFQCILVCFLKFRVPCPVSVHARFLVNKVVVGEFFPQVFRFSPVNVIPPVLHTHPHLHILFISKRIAQVWERSNEATIFRICGSYGVKSTFALFSIETVNSSKYVFVFKWKVWS